MNLQENISSLQKKLTQQDKLVQELSVRPEEAIEGWLHQTGEEPNSDAGLKELVDLKTLQLQQAAKDLHATQIALLHAQKMEAVGELATGMAHEINTPLQYIGGNLEFMHQAFEELTQCVASSMNLLEQAELEDEALQQRKRRIDFILSRLPKAIEQSTEGVENVSRIVRAMRRFSHIAEDRIEADLNDSIDSTLTVSRGEWKYVAEVEFTPDPELPKIVCLPGDLNQAFLNMIVNAAHAIQDKLGDNPEDKGLISISTSHDDENNIVKISDSGMGIPEELEDRIFDQFFTTKEIGQGTGQGLAICRSIVVEKHGGKIDVQSEAGKGTTFTISLPRDWQPDQPKKQV